MHRRALLTLMLAAAAPTGVASIPRLHKALEELEEAVISALGNVRLDIAVQEDERLPLLIRVRRV